MENITDSSPIDKDDCPIDVTKIPIEILREAYVDLRYIRSEDDDND